jgi:hypothetical protein
VNNPGAPSAEPAAGASRTRRRAGQKLLDAGSASGFIAYFSGLDITPSVKGLLLLAAPWIAIILTTAVALLSIFARGYSEIYIRRILNHELLRLSNAILARDSATEAERLEARADVDEIESAELRIRRTMRSRLNEMFETHIS